MNMNAISTKDFPDLMSTLTMAGRSWSIHAVGNFEHDQLTVSVRLTAGRTDFGPFEFAAQEFVDREAVPFTADLVRKLEYHVFNLMSAHWPLDF
jgi:hypothetical protein